MLTSPVRRTIIELNQVNKWERIKYHEKKNAIIMLDEAWNNFAFGRLENEDDAYSILFQNVILLSLLNKTANRFYKAWKNNSRITLHDFQSVLYEKAWNIIENYNPHNNWFLYEQLSKGMEQACIDLLRQQGLTKKRTNKNTYFHNSVSNSTDDNSDKEIPSDLNVELKALTNIFIEEELDDCEKKVAKLLLVDNNVTLDDICKEVGLKYRQQAKRVIYQIKNKLLD